MLFYVLKPLCHCWPEILHPFRKKSIAYTGKRDTRGPNTRANHAVRKITQPCSDWPPRNISHDWITFCYHFYDLRNWNTIRCWRQAQWTKTRFSRPLRVVAAAHVWSGTALLGTVKPRASGQRRNREGHHHCIPHTPDKDSETNCPKLNLLPAHLRLFWTLTQRNT